MLSAGGTYQVFDMQGKLLGKVEVAPGATITSSLKARFQNSGIYLVRQGNKMFRVAVK